MSGQQQQQHYRRDSFDRFGDDLGQLLVSYMTFRQKLLKQAVCRQWQHFIRQSVTELDLFQIYEKVRRKDEMAILCPIVEQVIKRLPNLVVIKCTDIWPHMEKYIHYLNRPLSYYRFMVDQLAISCPQLTSVLLDFGPDTASFNYLIDRLGHQLTDLAINEHCAPLLWQRLPDCPNLRNIYRIFTLYWPKLKYYSGEHSFRVKPLFRLPIMKQLVNGNDDDDGNCDDHHQQQQQVLLSKLRHLYYLYRPEDCKLFKLFADKYHQKLMSLELATTRDDTDNNKNYRFDQLCRQLQKFRHLRSLVWHSSQWEDDWYSIVNTVGHFAELKHFRIRVGMKTAPEFHWCLNMITEKCCGQLRSLTIEAMYECIDCNGINLNGGILIGESSLATCPQLLSLTLEAYATYEDACCIRFSRNLIRTFQQKLPKLQRLFISDVHLNDVPVVFRTLLGHRQLRHLYILLLKNRHSKRQYPKQLCLLRNCPQMISVQINDYTYHYIDNELYAITVFKEARNELTFKIEN